MRMGGTPPGAGAQEEVSELGPPPLCPQPLPLGAQMFRLEAMGRWPRFPLPIPLRPGAAGLAWGVEHLILLALPQTMAPPSALVLPAPLAARAQGQAPPHRSLMLPKLE